VLNKWQWWILSKIIIGGAPIIRTEEYVLPIVLIINVAHVIDKKLSMLLDYVCKSKSGWLQSLSPQHSK